MQRGFLPGRSMLKNVVEIGWASQKVSLLGPRGGIILFDVRAAFPSLDHRFMWETLQAIGLPEAFVKVLKLFYSDNRHFMKVQGRLYNGPTIRTGVRQGCPLSGILFAACVDILLTRLATCLRDHEMIRAYADDIAMVIRDYEQSAPMIARTFSDFGRISALHVKINKNILLFPNGICRVQPM